MASSPPPLAAAEGNRSHRTAHSSAKPSLHNAAATFSKPRKPSASLAGKPPIRVHPFSSKISAPPGRQSENKAEIENPQPVTLRAGIASPKNGEIADEVLKKGDAVVEDEASMDDKAVVTDVFSREEMAELEDENASPKKEKPVVEHQHASRKENVLVTGEPLRAEKALVEEVAEGKQKPVTNEALGTKTIVHNTEALRKESDQSDAFLLQEINHNDAAEREKMEDDCAEMQGKKGHCVQKPEKTSECAETYTIGNGEQNLLDQKEKEQGTVLLKHEGAKTENLLKLLAAPADLDPSSPLAKTEAIVYSDQTPELSACTGQKDAGSLKQQSEGELDVKQNEQNLIFTEHLDSEQEGFLFAKGEPIVKDSIQSSDGFPAGEFSTMKTSKEQEIVTSLSHFEAAVIAASDLKAAPSVCNDLSPVPPSEATGFMEAAMVALAKDVLATKCPPVGTVQRKTSALPSCRCPWKLSRRALLIPSVVVPAVFCLICFVSAVNQDESSYLHPT